MPATRKPPGARWRVVSILLVTLPGLAAAVDDVESVWAVFSASDSIAHNGEASRWRYWFDATGRWLDPGSGANLYGVRPAVGYDLNNKITIWAGYGWSRAESAAGDVAVQRRYWQQVSWPAGRLGKGRISMRLRLEQRELDIANDWRHVLRLQAKYTRPIGAQSRTNLILAVEPYFDLNHSDWGGDTGISQNRSFVGLGLPMTPDWSIEVGYLNQYVFAETSADRMNHVALLHLKYRP